MQIMTAIKEADALCPNPYTLSEKLLWCDEVSAAVRREVLKTYDTISVTWDGVQPLLLPDDICFEDIEALYANGQLMEKSDFRTVAKHALQYFGTGFSCPTELRAVYLTKPAPIREIEIRGTFNTNEDFIAMEAPPFAEGDTISFVVLTDQDADPDWESAKDVLVLDTSLDGIFLENESIEAQSGVPMAIRRIITDDTEIDEAPYDRMYIEYILAKMALYQHDYTGYTAHMTQYNTLFDSLKRDYKTRAPLTELANFKNYWR